MITGIVQTTRVNDYGYTSYKISSTWYGADSKGPPRASEGEKVAFEAFDKPGKDGRTFPTIKLATFKKVAASVAANGASPEAGSVSPANGTASKGNGSYVSQAASRDTYWADKAAEDSRRDPRIVYQSSYERAIAFTSLAIQNGAFDALAKAKPTAKLSILESFVNEQADRILKQVYLAVVPTADVPNKTAKVSQVAEGEIESDPEESWA